MENTPSPHPSEQRCGSCKQILPLSEYSPSYRGKPGTWCRLCFAAYNRDRKSRPVGAYEPIACAECGERFTPKQIKSNAVGFCSRACKGRHRNRVRKATTNDAKPHRRCVWCGVDIPKTMRADAKFCSSECNNKAHQSVRRWRRRTPESELKRRRIPLPSFIDIAERDGWKCGICGKPVNKRREYPDPLAGSLDHLIPVSQGGGHEMANLQLSHFVCNWSKHDRPANDRLRLL